MNILRPRHSLLACLLALAGCSTSDGFQNMANADIAPAQSPMKIWWRVLTESKVGTVPVDPVPVQPLTRAALDALDPKGVHIVRLGHSSHLLKLEGKYWLIDPVFSERASPVQWAGPRRFHPSPIALADLPPIEGLILSHDHYDHLDRATIEALALKVQRYYVPTGVGARLQSMQVPAERIQELGWWQAATHGGVQLTAAPSQHFSGRSLTDRNATLWASWLIRAGGRLVFYSGDSGYFPGFRQIGERFPGIDLALIENGAYDKDWPQVHMTPEESIRAFEDLKAKTLYSVHNSTFDLAFHPWREPMDRLAALASAKGIDLATPVIGEVMSVGQPRSNALWWAKLR
ncbi:MBL fold metallo-hydrolase [uncultured Ramlibacter sp.]|uniref:MBL fold metallo-hydrolase n=1 Tax=uncultured Ramlibacter sp. TaxID=260755 RepID=UPI002622E63B|nr:MBL fold metallo-hydrolase [uncultured Ramlibacter sp.]